MPWYLISQAVNKIDIRPKHRTRQWFKSKGQWLDYFLKIRPSLIYCLFPVPYFSTNWCGRRWLLIISYTVDFHIQLPDCSRVSRSRRCKTMSMFSKSEGTPTSQVPNNYIVCTTNTFSLTAEWFCASNYTYSVITWSIIKSSKFDETP